MDEQQGGLRSLEAQRVFARVARSMLGMEVVLPTLDRFEVRERMGAGGMGEVYGAYDPEHQRDVAIKVLRSDRDPDAAAMRRMRREARALTRLDHPNVVRVHEVGAASGQVFIAMELLRGETLCRCLARERRLSPAKTLAIVAAVCEALEHAHDHGVIHRDLKPGNIFLVEDGSQGGRVKVLDFGLAKIASAGTLDVSTASGTVMGTLHYMSPEQARDSSKLDHRGDLWAVAIITYECLVGRRPFDAESLAELAVQLLREAPPVPSAHGEVPADFDAWFARATHRDRASRYRSARALSDALAEALGQPSQVGVTRRTRRRRRAAWAAAAGVGVGAVVWGLIGYRPDPDPQPRVRSPVEEQSAPSGPAATPTVRAASTGVEEPVRPDTVELRLHGAPDGAEIWRADERIGAAPGPVVLRRAHALLHLRIEAAGFETLSVEVVPDRDQTRSVVLMPRPEPPAARRRRGDPKTHGDVEDLEF